MDEPVILGLLLVPPGRATTMKFLVFYWVEARLVHAIVIKLAVDVLVKFIMNARHIFQLLFG